MHLMATSRFVRVCADEIGLVLSSKIQILLYHFTYLVSCGRILSDDGAELIVVEVLVCNECLFANSASSSPTQCRNYGNSLSQFF